MFRPVAIDLYVVTASHPCAAVERALEMKGLAFRRIELPPPIHAPVQQVRFGAAPCRRSRIERRREDARARARSCARLEELVPSRRCTPPTRERRAPSSAPRSGATRCCSRSRAALHLGRPSPPARGDARPTPRARGSRLPAPCDRAHRVVDARRAAAQRGATDGDVRADLLAPRPAPRPRRRLDRRRRARRRGAERRRPADRATIAAAAHDRRRRAVHPAARPRRSRARCFPRFPGGRRAGLIPADWLAGVGRRSARRRRAASPTRRDALVERHPRQAVRRRVPSGVARSKSSSSSGISTKRRAVTCSCGSHSRSRAVARVAEQQEVDVDRARAVATPPEVAAELALDRLARVEQRLGLERGLDPQAGVEERRLVEHEADRIGVVGRGGRRAPHAVRGQRVDGGLQVRAAVADVRAEAEVAPVTARASGSSERELARLRQQDAVRASTARRPPPTRRRRRRERKTPSTGRPALGAAAAAAGGSGW